MNEVVTNKPLRVSTEGMSEKVGPFIWLPLSQVKEVEKLLEDNGIRFSTDEDALSMNDGPYMTFIRLRRGTDPVAVQSILDNIA